MNDARAMDRAADSRSLARIGILVISDAPAAANIGTRAGKPSTAS
jgi:hypothetical protein